MNNPDRRSVLIATARTLLTRCGVDTRGEDDDETLRRAEQIAAAAADYRARTADLASVLDAHLDAEFQARDSAVAMATMSAVPHLVHVPVLTGGKGRGEIERFYREVFIPGWPADTAVEPLSRTVGANRIVDELIVSFTHDREMPAIIPGVAPTGRRVELPHAVVVEFENGKIKSEHIYWDQASVLVQLGLLDQTGLPVTGIEQVVALRNPVSFITPNRG